jgi:putative tricarboxylic transport membrane protein
VLFPIIFIACLLEPTVPSEPSPQNLHEIKPSGAISNDLLVVSDVLVRSSTMPIVKPFLEFLSFKLSYTAALSRGKMVKGIFAGFLGVLVALIGTFADNQSIRMVPSPLKMELYNGFALLPVLIGLFAMSQMFEEAELGMKTSIMNVTDLKAKEAKKFSLRDFKGQVINVIRSASIGTFMGILPGVGGSAASLLSYSQAQSWSKEPEKLGKGSVEGLVASETANNGLTGGALVPLLSLGIPGDSTTAVLVGAFMLQGIQVGPLFISQNKGLWYTILFALLICNFVMFAMMFYPVKYIANIIKIPKNRLYPVVVIMCIVGAYAARNGNMFDIWTLLIFGLLGYIFMKIGLPSTPFLIGFILGGDLEKYFIDSLKGSGGSLSVFFTRPLGWVIWGLIAISIAYAIYDNRKLKAQEAANGAVNGAA